MVMELASPRSNSRLFQIASNDNQNSDGAVSRVAQCVKTLAPCSPDPGFKYHHRRVFISFYFCILYI